jgi:hypothetical protein
MTADVALVAQSLYIQRDFVLQRESGIPTGIDTPGHERPSTSHPLVFPLGHPANPADPANPSTIQKIADVY